MLLAWLPLGAGAVPMKDTGDAAPGLKNIKAAVDAVLLKVTGKAKDSARAKKAAKDKKAHAKKQAKNKGKKLKKGHKKKLAKRDDPKPTGPQTGGTPADDTPAPSFDDTYTDACAAGACGDPDDLLENFFDDPVGGPPAPLESALFPLAPADTGNQPEPGNGLRLTAVPEPTALALFVAGVAGWRATSRRRA
jgi:hypothetical protein